MGALYVALPLRDQLTYSLIQTHTPRRNDEQSFRWAT